MAPVGDVKAACGGVGIAVERDHIGCGGSGRRRRCGGCCGHHWGIGFAKVDVVEVHLFGGGLDGRVQFDLDDLGLVDLGEGAQVDVHRLPGTCGGGDGDKLAVLAGRDDIDIDGRGVLAPDVQVHLAQTLGRRVDRVKLEALVSEGIALEHLVGGDGGVTHHLALAPVGDVKAACGGVGIAVKRDHIGCGGSGRRWRRCRAFANRWPLIQPHIIHRHFIGEIPARHRSPQGPANGHIQDDVHRVVKRPVGRCGAVGFFVLVVGVVVVAVHTKADVVLRPPHLVGVEVGDGTAQGGAFLELGVSV